jgi:hypothetical protein
LRITRERKVNLSASLVVNGKYVGVWPAFGNSTAYQYDIEGMDQMPSELRAKIDVNSPPNVLRYGFGVGAFLLRDLLDVPPPGTVKALEQRVTGGGTAFKIVVSAPDFRILYLLDPNKGFLITYSTAERLKGGRWLASQDCRVGCEKTARGVWFPSKIERAWYPESAPLGKAKPSSLMKIAVSDIRCEERIPDEAFTVDALGFPKDKTTLLRAFVDGTKTAYVYRGDRLVPQLSDLEIARLTSRQPLRIRGASASSGERKPPAPGAKATPGPRPVSRADSADSPPIPRWKIGQLETAVLCGAGFALVCGLLLRIVVLMRRRKRGAQGGS